MLGINQKTSKFQRKFLINLFKFKLKDQNSASYLKENVHYDFLELIFSVREPYELTRVPFAVTSVDSLYWLSFCFGLAGVTETSTPVSTRKLCLL